MLAEGHDFPVQAMRYGDKAYGIQFHPELTTPMMHLWLEFGKARLALPGAQPLEAHVEGREKYDLSLRLWLSRFMDNWLPESAGLSPSTAVID